MSLARRSLVGPSPQRPGDDLGGSKTPLGEPRGDAAELLDRPADQGAGRRAVAPCPLFLGAAPRSPDAGSRPAWRRPASRARRAGASRARSGSRCGRARAPSWRSRSRPRSPSDAPRPRPASRSRSRPGTRSRRRRARHRRWNGGPAGPGSTGRCGRRRTRRPRDRPAPDKPSRGAANPWCHRRPRGAPTPMRAAPGRSLPRRRPPTACRPRS
jgi:hypothetical protein